MTNQHLAYLSLKSKPSLTVTFSDYCWCLLEVVFQISTLSGSSQHSELT